MVKNIISVFHSWTIDDVLETDTRMLYEILFTKKRDIPDTQDSFNFIKSL
ncbi:hypothetical protein [uncultured Enterococcus sp.]|nr:hypothetical protein [uncultured Enterococcus sp.]